MGWYRRTLTIGMIGVVGGADAMGDSVLEALDLLDDLATALEADKSLGVTPGSQGPKGFDLQVVGSALDGDDIDAMGLGVVEAECVVTWITKTGD
jgi:hypothetical protein